MSCFPSGYGSQALALKYLGVKFEHWKICEWAVKSIQAYNDLHIQDYFDYSGNLSDDNILKVLVELGVSINYNEPATREQLKRQNFRKIYNNIIATNNLVNIQNAKGEYFKIVDKDQYEYIMTYSFPCQDLSLAGKGKGMADTSTRSGMLWEVERILNELKTTNSLPQILLMENVPQVHGSGNVEHFNKWQLALERLGYKSYFQDLIATDYGIPQTRNRCFMVSILGDYSYTFPKPIPLKLKLKDLLEDEVDEKYYLSDKQLESLESGSYNASKPSVKLEITDKGLCQTLDTMSGGNRQPLVRVGNKSLQETLEQNNIDDTCYIDTYNKRIDKEKTGTITTGVSFRNNSFIAIKNNTKKGYLEATDNGGKDRGVCVGTYQYAKSDKFMNGKDRLQLGKETSDTLQTSPKEGVCYNDLRIRKLTPRECGRLMNVKDEDITKMLKNQSDSSAYHCFGDSICTNCLMAIFGELLDINWKQKLEEMLYGNTN